MPLTAWFTIILLTAMFTLLIKTKLPPVAIFLGALTIAVVLNLTSLKHGLKGFSNPGVLTIGALLMVSAGMNATGAVNFFTEPFFRPSNTVSGTYRNILPPVAAGAAFLDNATIVPMLIPNFRELSLRKQLPASKLFLPLSYAALLGGAITLIGTPANLIIAGLVENRILSPNVNAPFIQELSLFDPAWIGLPVALTGIGFIILFGNRLLPDRKKKNDAAHIRRLYRAEFCIPENSKLIGQTLEQAGLAGFKGAELVMVSVPDRNRKYRYSEVILRKGDFLAYHGTVDGLAHLWKNTHLMPVNTIKPMVTSRHTHQLVEVTAASTALAIGREITQLSVLNHPYKMAVVGMSRHGKPLAGDISHARIEVGDNVVLEVDDSFFYHNRNEAEFALIKKIPGFKLKRTDRAFVATAITFAMVITAAMGWLNLLTAALLAAGLMIITGCLELRTAGSSVNFANLIVLACAVGLESVIVDSGLSEIIVSAVIGFGAPNPHLALATIYVTTVIAANLISGASAVALVFPVALYLAGTLNMIFTPFAVTMMMAACPFITPAATPTNLAVYGPGGYRFRDYIRLGMPLTILSGTLTVLLVPIFYPFEQI